MKRSSRFLLSTTLALLALTAAGQSQAPQGPGQPPPARPGTGVIAGVVLDGSGQPVTDALVVLGGRGGQERVIVDPRGRFVFRHLLPGAFGVAAARPGYVGGALDQQEPTSAGRPIELADNDQVTNVTLRLWKTGAIAGTVRNDAGEPLAGVEMQLLRRALIGGRRMIAPAAVTSADDLGHYRFDGLVPGDYLVAARPDRDPETALLLAMLTATPAVSVDVMAALSTTGRARPEPDGRVQNYPLMLTAPVNVTAGSERANVDLQVKRAPTIRVSGTLTEPADGVTLQLVPVDASGAMSPIDAAVTACDETGDFEFTGVTAGRYVIKVQAAPPPAPGQPPPLPPGGPAPAPQGQLLQDGPAWSGSLPIAVGATDVTKISLPIHRGVAVTGRLVFTGAAPLPTPQQLSQITLRLDPVDQPPPTGQATWRGFVSADARFRTVNVPPGDYLLRVGAPPRGWTLQSATFNGHDVLDVPVKIAGTAVDGVEIGFSDAPLPSIGGAVHDANNAPVPNSTVVVFPADRTMWRDSTPQARRLRVTRPATSGRFGVQNLPTGEYLLVAVTGELPSEWQDAERLSALSKVATKISVAAGPQQPIDLSVTPAAKWSPGSLDPGKSDREPGLKTRPPSAGVTRQPGLKTRPPSAALATGVLTGTVIDQKSGRPVNQATVVIAGADVGLVRVTATDARGLFTFSELPAGHFLVGAGKAPYLAAVHGASRPGRPGTLVAVRDGQHVNGLSIGLVHGAVIAGRVTDDHDRPVPGARVRVIQHRVAGGDVAMTADAGDPVTVTTDDRGAYRVFNLPPGEYAVAVQARGVINGDVRRLTEADIDNDNAATAPTPVPQNGMAVGWAPAYAPSTTLPAEAVAVTVAAGDVRSDVNVRTALARFARVEGAVTGATASALGAVQISLRPRGMNASGGILVNLQTRPGPDGRFMFPNVPPGDYTVMARTQPPPPQPNQFPGPPPSNAASVRWALSDIAVHEENVTDVNLELRPGIRVSGAVRAAGFARLPADLPLIRVGLRATPGSAIQNLPDAALLDKAGRFAIDGVVPGRYRVYLQVPNNDVLQVPAWFALTANVDGANIGDVFDVPIDVTGDAPPEVSITITESTQEIDGVVHDAAGSPARDCTVIVFSTDRTFWFQQSRRIATRQSARDGRFVFGIAAGLPKGEYYVAAVPDGRPGDQLDVLLLEELAKTAERVTLNADETKTVEVKIKK